MTEQQQQQKNDNQPILPLIHACFEFKMKKRENSIRDEIKITRNKHIHHHGILFPLLLLLC